MPEFVHNGLRYDECTRVNSPDSWRPWCKTFVGRSVADDKWGLCDCEEPYPPLDGSCELYNAGPVCEPYLNGSTVFVDNRYNQTFLQNEVLERLNSSFYELTGSYMCAVLSLQIFCHLLFPGCQTFSDTNGTVPLLLCFDSCDALSRSPCGPEFRNEIMKEVVIDLFRDSQWNPVHFYSSVPVCQGLLRNDSSNDSCLEISIDIPLEDKKTKQSTEDIVIAAVVVPTAVSIVLVTLLCLWRRKTNKKFIPLADLEFSKIVWDDDVAQAIPESLIDQKRLELEMQIGEGENEEHSLNARNCMTHYITFSGNFGNVYKGTLDGQTTVAVKGLKSGQGHSNTNY